jgi:hypothetical protein
MSEVSTETRDWLQKVEKNKVVLRQFLQAWHPSSQQMSGEKLPITAPNAENACAAIRESIKRREQENPLERWDRALQKGDVQVIYSLLNSAWFGVPESTECWSIPGFKEAVDLLEDPPEGDNDEAA